MGRNGTGTGIKRKKKHNIISNMGLGKNIMETGNRRKLNKLTRKNSFFEPGFLLILRIKKENAAAI